MSVAVGVVAFDQFVTADAEVLEYVILEKEVVCRHIEAEVIDLRAIINECVVGLGGLKVGIATLHHQESMSCSASLSMLIWGLLLPMFIPHAMELPSVNE